MEGDAVEDGFEVLGEEFAKESDLVVVGRHVNCDNRVNVDIQRLTAPSAT